MERLDHAAVATFFHGTSLAAADVVELDEGAAHHARVRRLQPGSPARLVDGRGHVAHGELMEMGKRAVTMVIRRVEQAPVPSSLEAVVPVSDRERMLLAAEKCVELQITAWRPVYFARSRSVSPRGEGDKFRDKVLARMQHALEQSGGAWLPTLHQEGEWMDVMAQVPAEYTRILLDRRGKPLPRLLEDRAVALAVGPEGGLEPQEIRHAEELGWRVAALGGGTLRFETAVIAGVAIVRAAQFNAGG